jgi:hypothetical protein
VSAEGDVTGVATIPNGSHLWIFCHRKGLGLWWPQGGGPAQLKDGKYSVVVTYGLPRDAGSSFELIAAVVDEAKHAELLNWVREAETKGSYPGMVLPASRDGCVTKTTIVTKDR